jgi:PEP-CTERM motif-containing protein
MSVVRALQDMTMRLLRLAMVCLVLGLSAPALAGPIAPDTVEPSAFVVVDGVTHVFELTGPPGGPFVIGAETFTFPSGDIVQVFQGLLNPDPSIAYAVGVTDVGAPSTFGFTFFTPITPTGAPNVVFASLVGGFIDVTGDGYSFTPSPGPLAQVSEVGPPSTNMGVDVGPAFSVGAAVPGTPYTYGTFTDGPQPGPGPGPWTILSVELGFSLAGGGDTAALTGFARIDEDDRGPADVPEPSTVILGLGVLAGLLYRQRRR